MLQISRFPREVALVNTEYLLSLKRNFIKVSFDIDGVCNAHWFLMAGLVIVRMIKWVYINAKSRKLVIYQRYKRK